MIRVSEPRALSLRGAVLALSQQGRDPNEIADTLGRSLNCVQSTITQLRRLGHSIPYQRATLRRGDRTALTLDLSREDFDRLAASGRARNLGPHDLATRLIEIAIREGMVDAIMDDGE